MILPSLSWIFLIPILAFAAMVITPASDNSLHKRIAQAGTLLPFLLSLLFFQAYDQHVGGFQFVENIPWVSRLGISYHVGIDGINALMLILTGAVSFSAVCASQIKERSKEYYLFLLTIVSGTFGAFLSLDIFVFYFFHEVAAIPVFLMMLLWGSGKRDYAAMKLTLFLIAGAGLALVGLIALFFATGLYTFDFVLIQQHLSQNPIPLAVQNWIFPIIVLGFGITLTLWPFYTWAPEGYTSAPTAVSMLHAGVLKKMGAYAIIRFAVQLMPEAASYWMPIIATLAVFNILFCGFVALVQKDFKMVLSYSSCSHMGYILLGLACVNVIGISGVVFLMFAHGIMAGLAFALEGCITSQTKTRNLSELGGLVKAMPFVGTCFIMVCLASAGVPGFGNFVAEILVLTAAWDQYRWQTVAAVLGIVITAIYMLKVIRLGFQGPANSQLPTVMDAKTPFAKLPFIILLALLILVGCWPSLVLHKISPSTQTIAERSL